ncbi:MAG: iron-sulfur cluster repair di-iron protein, ric [Firmicutes bacterium]|nr:iron-sulfur cluster repair di-iron protein, ric [Bacillota bacterium]
MTNFNQVKERTLKTLAQYVPIVARVHGESHPEFHDVHRVFQAMQVKLNENVGGQPELEADFEQLRQITQNYTVPVDVCESYEAVYQMLADLDKAYHS